MGNDVIIYDTPTAQKYRRESSRYFSCVDSSERGQDGKEKGAHLMAEGFSKR